MRNFGESAVILCSAAAGLLGWRQREFWCATPVELGACLGAQCAPDLVPDADTIAELQQRFPD